MVQFCAFSEKDKVMIRDVMNTCFSFTDYSQIASAYNFFTKNYYHPEPHGPQVIDRLTIKLKTDQTWLNKNISNSEYWTGIDLPILLTGNERSTETIFIVGEDPLRNTANENIVLSTPYGTHLKKNRTGRQRLYWDIAVHLIEIGYNIYYTDTKKLWLKSVGAKKEIFPQDVQNTFRKALRTEVEYFEPTLIITYGGEAAKAIKEIGIYSNKVLSFLHPSWQANPQWKKVLSKWLDVDTVSATNQRKFNFIVSSIRKEIQLLETSAQG